MESPALRRFSERAAEVELLLSLCSGEHMPLPERMKTRMRDTALCRSALVLLCSHMEGFFEDLLVACLRFHEMNGTPASCLPLRLRVVQLWHANRLADGASDESIWRIIELLRDSPLAHDETVCSCGLLASEPHVHGFAVPGSREVEKLFASVGISNIWDVPDQDADEVRRLKTSLDALVYRRHPVAHGDAGSSPTRADITTYLTEMTSLASHIDHIVGNRLGAAHGANEPWVLLAEL